MNPNCIAIFRNLDVPNLLKIVYDTRMDNAHGGFTRATTNWRAQLESAVGERVVQILDFINMHDLTLKFQVIIDRLHFESKGL